MATENYLKSFLQFKNINTDNIKESEYTSVVAHFSDRTDFIVWLKNYLELESLEEELSKEKEVTDADIAEHNSLALMDLKSKDSSLRQQLTVVSEEK